ncbi:MAG: GntR family transcriptional regulator [Deltaproteobacteria bacterium]|nr:MAG: GntR family transcriptional regulator [Deltaproteobacteria bacterium]
MVDSLNYSSLGRQVYLYLRKQMNQGILTPGSSVNMGEIARNLGISKTPLRDALIHLECEGFVTILPRKGVLVNQLSLDDVRQAYETVGLIEAHIIQEVAEKISEEQIQLLCKINEKMNREILAGDFSNLFESNLNFHNTYLEISDNSLMKSFILPIKHRLYDFPKHNFIADWELRNGEDHEQLIECLRKRDGKGAARILKDVHWSFEKQKEFIYRFYSFR